MFIYLPFKKNVIPKKKKAVAIQLVYCLGLTTGNNGVPVEYVPFHLRSGNFQPSKKALLVVIT